MPSAPPPRHSGKSLRGMDGSQSSRPWSGGADCNLSKRSAASKLQQGSQVSTSQHSTKSFLLSWSQGNGSCQEDVSFVVPPGSLQVFLSLSLLFRSPAALNLARRLAKTAPMSLVLLNHGVGSQSVDPLYRQFWKRQETGPVPCRARVVKPRLLPTISTNHLPCLHQQHQKLHRHLLRKCLMAVGRSVSANNTRKATACV
ncbi:hypothetical protein IWX49DRAFT_170489 [Phyllosticta citricarpa]|uniref:Uncharacterized protein n=2 Tax=Phyllosticta TaxID=121621 RepID=A0ABR1M6K3_9PEZI